MDPFAIPLLRSGTHTPRSPSGREQRKGVPRVPNAPFRTSKSCGPRLIRSYHPLAQPTLERPASACVDWLDHCHATDTGPMKSIWKSLRDRAKPLLQAGKRPPVSGCYASVRPVACALHALFLSSSALRGPSCTLPATFRSGFPNLAFSVCSFGSGGIHMGFEVCGSDVSEHMCPLPALAGFCWCCIHHGVAFIFAMSSRSPIGLKQDLIPPADLREPSVLLGYMLLLPPRSSNPIMRARLDLQPRITCCWLLAAHVCFARPMGCPASSPNATTASVGHCNCLVLSPK